MSLRDFFHKHRFVIAWIIAVASTFVLITTLNAKNQGDVAWYQWVITDMFAGKFPYLAHTLEYPPYAIIIFLIPELVSKSNYLIAFMIMALCADLAVKFILYRIGKNSSASVRRPYMPLLLYSVAVPFISYFYLQRYDIWPALITVLAIWLFSKKKFGMSGGALAVGVGIKFYPVVFGLPLLILSIRQKKWKPFLLGILWGILPLILVSFVLPWWHFAEFQSARGIQVESIYASLLWTLKLFGLTQLVWIRTIAWFEVQGVFALAVLPWVRALYIFMVTFSIAISTWIASKHTEISVAKLSRLVLIPLVGFVAFNTVLSPQYMIWLIPLAALASLEGTQWPVWAIVIATMLTPIFYPTLNYFSNGLNAFQTFALLARNLLLVIAWIGFIGKLPTSSSKSSSYISTNCKE